MNRAIGRRSSSAVTTLDVVCHGGGRGFAERLARFGTAVRTTKRGTEVDKRTGVFQARRGLGQGGCCLLQARNRLMPDSVASVVMPAT